ncbi:hypothetical protein [uncultured Microscilla sp.]|uniref:hypothetical protein n=1 Tax=uncultured Microscilla sp. TaxID=432653 RepID=UPI002629A2D9|nr:hypothetical protein [uncultured Microscilla sp.]
MRLIDNIPHPKCSITLLTMNQKYILKFEQNNLEQTYKISEMDVTGEAEVREIAQDTEFIEKVLARFETMEEDFYKVLQGY